ncbi:MAG: YdcF family protein [Alphaproteobacteria bacterium]|nr:YdcF family protein [Alphaproteobacteria bacterium]
MNLFFASKVFWAVFAPTSVLVWLSLLGLLCVLIGRQSAGLAVLSLVAVLVLVVALTPLGPWMLRDLEAQYSRPAPMPEAVSGVILLGGSEQTTVSQERQAPSLTGAGERYVAFAELARRYPDAPLLFSGGVGQLDRSVPPETTVLFDIVHRLGIDEARIVVDDRARNTRENAAAIRRMIDAGELARDGRPFLLITSAFHMPRAVRYFEQAGVPITPYPCDWRSKLALEWFPGLGRGVEQFSIALRERIGMLAARLF